jgi:hypothetical protein
MVRSADPDGQPSMPMVATPHPSPGRMLRDEINRVECRRTRRTVSGVAFQSGEGIVLREVWRGRVFEARPTTVVQDEPAQTMLLLPGGVRCGLPIGADGRELRLPDRPWRLEIRPRGPEPFLSFAWPDTPYSVLLWTTSDDRKVWYVNLQDPLTRTPLGFDTIDHALDVVIELDRSAWRWKDEEELAEAVRNGLFTPEEAAEFRSWGERAIDRIASREPPFDQDWTGWRPDPAWHHPRLPDGWDVLPG